MIRSFRLWNSYDYAEFKKVWASEESEMTGKFYASGSNLRIITTSA